MEKEFVEEKKEIMLLDENKIIEAKESITVDNIYNRVYIIRGQQVMLDYDLAELYGYEVKTLNQQVKRNIDRFPEDFMFQLKKEEIPEDFLKSQIVTLNEKGYLMFKVEIFDFKHFWVQSFRYLEKTHCNRPGKILQVPPIPRFGYYKCHILFESNCF